MNDNVNTAQISVILSADKKYIESLTEERAQRARLVRRMTGLTRVAFTEKYGVSASNFQNWEGPRYGGLTEKAARKLVNICAQEGVKASVEWLMYGSGRPPEIISKHDLNEQQIPSKWLEEQEVTQEARKVFSASATTTSTSTTFSGQSGQQVSQQILQQEDRSVELVKIAQESELFKQNYNHEVLVAVVVDKAMEPVYKIGDYVAGKRYSSNIAAFLQKECIVELTDKKLLVRVLQPSKEEHKYNLVSYNPEVRPVIMTNVEILSVAPIIWIRRLGG